jgi:hypothetical protein
MQEHNQQQEQNLALYQQAEGRNLNAVSKANADNTARNWESLSQFSGTLSKYLVEETQRQSQRDMEDGLMQAYLDGIDPAEEMAFNIAEGYLKDTDDQIQAVGDAAQASGAPFMGVQKLRSLSGWKQYGYAMGVAQNAQNAYGQSLETLLKDMPPNLSSAEKAAYLSNARAQFFQQTGLMGINPALLNKYAFPGMREVDSAYLNKWRKQDEDAAKEEIIAEGQQLIAADPTGNFSKVIDTFTRAGMTRGKAREEALKLLTTTEEIDDIGNQLSWDGKLTWAEKYPIEFREARRQAAKREQADYDESQAELHLEAKQWLDQVVDSWEQNPPSEEEIEAVQQKLEDDFQGYTDPRLERWKGRSTDAESKNYYTQQFQELDRAGMLTEAMLNDPAVPYSVRQSFLARAQTLDKARKDTPEFKQYTKQIEEDLKRHSGNESVTDLGKAGLELAVAKAQGKFQRDFAAALNTGTMSAEQAAANAYANFQRDLQLSTPDNPAGIYYVDDKDGFKNVMPKGYSSNWIQHKAKIDNILSSGASTLDSHALIPVATLNDALKNVNNPSYQYPAIATYISNRFGGTISPWEVLNRQAQARGLGQLPMNPHLQRQTAGMSPEMVRLLHYKPSYNRVARAYASTGSFDPSRVPNGYGSVILQAASANGVDPAILAGLIEVESNFNPKARSVAGAVGIAQIMPGYHPTVDPTNATASIHYAAKYLRELTAQLGDPMEAIYAYNGGPGGIRKSAENRAYQPKVLRAAAKYGYNPTGGSPWRNPAFMSPRLAYVTGNEGPTSTGPHLDVKRVDRGNFKPTDLDRYVMVDDPQYGRVPLSKVGTSDGQAEHRARGSHGIDYRTASGSKVYLKGGAKVVGSVRTKHGDQLTIQLPNGKQYTFLHGRSA